MLRYMDAMFRAMRTPLSRLMRERCDMVVAARRPMFFICCQGYFFIRCAATPCHTPLISPPLPPPLLMPLPPLIIVYMTHAIISLRCFITLLADADIHCFADMLLLLFLRYALLRYITIPSS